MLRGSMVLNIFVGFVNNNSLSFESYWSTIMKLSKLLLLYWLMILSHSFSQNTLLKQTSISSIAINTSAENSKLTGTVGQAFIGDLESNNTILSSGFWGSIAFIMLDIDDVLPIEFFISNAYPNPFNPTVNIDFSIPEESDINIKIFDLLGRNIFNHKQNFNAPGKYRFQWHGLHDSGTPIASGVYLVTIQHKTNIFKQKITFLK